MEQPAENRASRTKVSDALSISSQNKSPEMSPIQSSYAELATQLAILDEVIITLGYKLEPVRNTYPSLSEKEPSDEPPKSIHRRIVDESIARVKYARITIENYISELEV